MTRPIYEPTLYRKDASLQYGQDQLFRRPAPSTGQEFKIITCKSITGSETMTSGNTNVLWQVNVEPNPECFTPILLSGSDYYQVRFHEDGLYTASCTLNLLSTTFDFDWQLGIYSVDFVASGPHLFRQTQGTYNHLSTFGTADLTWTFRMEGSVGSTPKIEFQFINSSASSATVENAYIEVIKYPGDITMVGRGRSTNPG